MKKLISLFLILAMALCMGSVASASDDSEIVVFLNGNEIVFPDQKPVVVNDRTLVPLRGILEAMGATVGWDDATSTVTSEKDGVVIKLTIDEPVIYKNGEAIEIDVPAQLINQRTMVPARAVSECFGARVEWNDELSYVVISTDELLNSALDIINSSKEFYWRGSTDILYQGYSVTMAISMGFDFKNDLLLTGIDMDMNVGFPINVESNVLTSNSKVYYDQNGEISVEDTTEVLDLSGGFADGTPFVRKDETETEVTYDMLGDELGMSIVVDKETAMPVKMLISKEKLGTFVDQEGFYFESDMTGDIVLNGGMLIERLNEYEAALTQQGE